MQDYIAAERKSLQEAKAMADSATQAEIARLQSQNVLLNRALDSEREKAERAKDELVKRMIGLFDSFIGERARSLRDTFSELTDSNREAETGMTKLGKEQGQRLETAVSRGKEVSSSLDKRAGESKRLRDGGFKVCSTVTCAAHLVSCFCRLLAMPTPPSEMAIRTWKLL